jgi:hypothetical protein
MITVSTPVDLLGLALEAGGGAFVMGLGPVLGVELVAGGSAVALGRLVADAAVVAAVLEVSPTVESLVLAGVFALVGPLVVTLCTLGGLLNDVTGSEPGMLDDVARSEPGALDGPGDPDVSEDVDGGVSSTRLPPGVSGDSEDGAATVPPVHAETASQTPITTAINPAGASRCRYLIGTPSSPSDCRFWQSRTGVTRLSTGGRPEVRHVSSGRSGSPSRP